MTLPNAITLLRLLLVPVFAWLHATDRPLAALIVFIAAAASDGIDGFLARALNQRSALGAILDPLADKVLGLTALIVLVTSGTMPAWFLGVSLLRDAVVFGVGITAQIGHKAVRASPTRVSKYATFTLMLAVTLGLLSRSPRFAESVWPFFAAVGVIAAECLLVATAQYLMLWRAVVRTRRA